MLLTQSKSSQLIASKKKNTLRIETARAFLPLLAPSRYKGLYGGRGSGKSHFFAELLIEQCLMRPIRAVGVREIQRSLEQSVKRLIEDKIAKFGLGSKFRCLQTHIEAPNGGIIIFQGMQNHTAESIKSLEGYDLAWVEEAQSMSQRSLDLLRPTIRKPGSELWFSWNPRAPTDPVDSFLRANKPSNAVVLKVNWSENPWFPNVLREDMEYDKRRDPDRYRHVWLGDYQRNSEARVFRNWRIGEREEFRTNPERFYFGADWGFSVDPTVLVRCYVEGRSLFIDREAYGVGVEIDRTPELFDRIENARKWPITADSSDPQNISYMRRHGYPRIQPSIKGTNSVEQGVEFLKSYDIVVHPDCKHTIDELSMYSYKIDSKTEEVLPVLEDKKNHVIDSLRYAIEGLRRGKGFTATEMRL